MVILNGNHKFYMNSYVPVWYFPPPGAFPLLGEMAAMTDISLKA
jgi:hypothetical protein